MGNILRKGQQIYLAGDMKKQMLLNKDGTPKRKVGRPGRKGLTLKLRVGGLPRIGQLNERSEIGKKPK